MTVRAATDADLDALRVLHDALVDETGDRPFLRVPWEQRLERLRASIAAGLTLVAETERGVIAFVEGSRLTSQLGWIRNVYVVPRSRRAGIARALIVALARSFETSGLTHVGIKVGSSNEVANRVYECLGFEEFSRALAIDVGSLVRRA